MFGYQHKDGEFIRGEVGFRNRVREPERGRYHLYVSLACPWSHRTVLMREIRKLTDVISMSVTSPIWNENGWYFGDDEGVIPDTINGLRDVIDIYRKVKPDFSEPCGDRLTEADLALFVTLIRFDAVYVTHFKCNLRRILDYPNLSRWLRELYEIPEVKRTCSFDHIKKHYFGSHRELNPFGIIPVGPARLV